MSEPQRCYSCEVAAARKIAAQKPPDRPAIPELDWFFQYPVNVVLLRAEIASWGGTPFVEKQAIKQAGADCVQWAEAVMVNVGAMSRVARWPEYRVTAGGREMLRELAGALRSIDNLVPLPELKRAEDQQWYWDYFLPGDVLLHSSGRAFHHLAIWDQYPTIWHCHLEGCSVGAGGRMVSTGVQAGNIKDPIAQKTLFAVYRFRIL